jgi:hypothetical protein
LIEWLNQVEEKAKPNRKSVYEGKGKRGRETKYDDNGTL